MPLKACLFSEGDTQPSDQSLNGRTTVERESQSFLKPPIKHTWSSKKQKPAVHHAPGKLQGGSNGVKQCDIENMNWGGVFIYQNVNFYNKLNHTIE